MTFDIHIFEDVPSKERFPDNDRTVCRFGRVITGATVEDDGTEGGISQFPGRYQVNTQIIEDHLVSDSSVSTSVLLNDKIGMQTFSTDVEKRME